MVENKQHRSHIRVISSFLTTAYSDHPKVIRTIQPSTMGGPLGDPGFWTLDSTEHPSFMASKVNEILSYDILPPKVNKRPWSSFDIKYSSYLFRFVNSNRRTKHSLYVSLLHHLRPKNRFLIFTYPHMPKCIQPEITFFQNWLIFEQFFTLINQSIPLHSY